MKGQAGKEAQIIQLQSALITAENKVGFNTCAFAEGLGWGGADNRPAVPSGL